MTACVGRGVDIALFDSDSAFRSHISQALDKDNSFTLRTFAAPADLLQACCQRRPDIIILETKSKGFQSDDVLLEVRKRWPELCVIVVTCCPSLENMRAAFKLDVFDYLIKPFPLIQLSRTLYSAVEAYQLGFNDPGRIRNRLGHRIRLLRTERGWSLKELAELTNLSVSQISSIERGVHLPSIESLLTIARAFSLRPSALLSSIDS